MNYTVKPQQLGKTVAIVYNLKHTDVTERTDDAQAEYDSIGTVRSIESALISFGYHTLLVEANSDFVENIKQSNADIVFNIAEGCGGRGRESQVPAILSMLGIPFTGSDETTLCIALDKALTKRILSTYRVRSPKGITVSHGKKYSLRGLRYPVIVKPNAEGSSKGISDVSVAEDAAMLKKILDYDLANYDGDMLVEEYITGREFTVACLGNGDGLQVFPPLEIVFLRDVNGKKVYSYHVKKEFERYVRLDCPSTLDQKKQDEMRAVAKRVYNAMQCRDFARMDFMLSNSGELFFIEINPLPGLAPHYSDFPFITEHCSISYEETVHKIIEEAEKRLDNCRRS